MKKITVLNLVAITILIYVCSFAYAIDTLYQTNKLYFKDAGSGNKIGVQPPSLSGSWNLTLPTTSGSLGQILSTDGSGNTDWIDVTGGSVGANTALSNLVTTSINQDLIPSLDNNFNIGSSSLIWNTLFAQQVKTSSGQYSIDLSNRRLLDSAGVATIDWDDKIILTGGTTVFNWSTKTLGSTTDRWDTYLSAVRLYGSTSGAIGMIASPVTTNYNITWPASQGGASTVLTNNGSGVLSWATPATATPAGSNTQIQYNNSGSFGASANLTFDSATTKLALGGSTTGFDTSMFYTVAGTAGVEVIAANLINNSNSADTAVSLAFTPNSNIQLAKIKAHRTAANGDTSLAFFTYDGDTASYSEKMRIWDAGDFAVGSTTLHAGRISSYAGSVTSPLYTQSTAANSLPVKFERVNASQGGASGVIEVFMSGDADVTGGAFAIFRNGSGTEIGSIKATNNTNIAFNTASDARLKRYPSDFDGLSMVMRMKPKEFSWRDDDSKKRFKGFYAQELYQVFPEAVTVGSPKMGEHFQPWTVDYSKLTPILARAIQQLKEENDSMKRALCELTSKKEFCGG